MTGGKAGHEVSSGLKHSLNSSDFDDDDMIITNDDDWLIEMVKKEQGHSVTKDAKFETFAST